MRLDPVACWTRLGAVGHGVLGTVHPARGVDAVPVVYLVEGASIVIPIDAVKPKSGRRLQRLANLDGDDRAVLLVEHYEDDWSQLWWVRLRGRAHVVERDDRALELLRAKYPQYRERPPRGPFILVDIGERVTWSADS